LTGAIYRKSFRLSPTARHQTSTGQVGKKKNQRKTKKHNKQNNKITKIIKIN